MKVWGKTIWAACMCVIYDSGMRPIELRHLRWGDIYPEEGAAIVRRPKRGRKTKDGQAVGIVRAARLSPRSVQELAIWRAETAHAAPADLVFTLNGKVAVTDAGIVEAFRHGLREVKEYRPEWTTYWLRHSFVTYALAKLPPEKVAELAGHSVAIAEGTYSHPDDRVILERTREARAMLDGENID
jgi:integrase